MFELDNGRLVYQGKKEEEQINVLCFINAN